MIDLRLAHEVRGPVGAPAILLIRPLGGSMASWGAFADALATRLRVIAFDPRARPPLVTSTRSMARDALALLDELGVPRAHVYGISLGGMVATWLAIDAPARVDRLVLASTAPRGTMIGRGAIRGALLVARGLARPRSLDASRRAILVRLAAAARHDTRGRLGKVAAETLILVGQRDHLVARRAARRLEAGIPHARLEVVPHAGHDLSAEAPDEVAARVLAWIVR